LNWKYKIDSPVETLDEIHDIAKKLVEENGPYRVVLAVGQDLLSLSGLNMGREQGLVEPILVGHPRRINETLDELGFRQQDWMIYSEKDYYNATQKAARLVMSGMGDILMRGKLLARDFFKALFDHKLELRKSGSFWSNVVILEIDELDRLIYLTDPALVAHTDIPGRLKIIQNATYLASFLGNDEPKISLLAAVESVTPGMPVSLEEAAISKMSERGQFPEGVVVDGPLSLDLSINPEAVKKKKMDSPVAGRADILVVNNVHIGNVLFKSLVTLCGAKSASTIIGPEFPIVLTSRSESPQNILYSLALSIMMVGDKD